MNANYPRLRILIPARGGSTRIKQKNLQEIVPGKSLVQWCVELYQAMLPGTPIVVATECHETSKLAIKLGCALHGRRPEDIDDTRPGYGIIQDIQDCYPDDDVMLVHCTSPFTFKSEVIKALDKSYPFIMSGYQDRIYLPSYGHAKTQTYPVTTVFTGNFMIARAPFENNSVFTQEQSLSVVSRVSSHDIDEQLNLDEVRRLASVINHRFLLTN